MTLPETGTGLEARLQRYFFACGASVERSLVIRTGRYGTKTATDVDVLAATYAANFHRSIFHAECKGEKKSQTLDRSFWLSGLRSFLHANRSLLVVDSFDVETSDFARELDIELVSFATLRELEQAYAMNDAWWPGRSAYQVWDPVAFNRERYESVIADETLSSALRDLWSLCVEDGWRVFSYSSFNRLVRLLGMLAAHYSRRVGDTAIVEVLRLAFSTALVRLDHYLLAICADLLPRERTERERYLTDKLRFGDLNARKAETLVSHAVRMVEVTLAEHKVMLPPQWQPKQLLDRPLVPPAGLVSLLTKLMDMPESAMHLPYAAEMVQFGFSPDPRGIVDNLVSRGRAAHELVLAFLVQETRFPEVLIQPPDPARLAQLSARGSMGPGAQPTRSTRGKRTRPSGRTTPASNRTASDASDAAAAKADTAPEAAAPMSEAADPNECEARPNE